MEYSKDVIFDVKYNNSNAIKGKSKWTSRVKSFLTTWRNHKIILSVVTICLGLIILDIALIYSFAELLQTMETMF